MQLFSELFAKGGMAIHDGDMGRALYWFQQALKVDPSNDQTRKMVDKLVAVGTQPSMPDADEGVGGPV